LATFQQRPKFRLRRLHPGALKCLEVDTGGFDHPGLMQRIEYDIQ
jgi:hypothetical protein